MGSGLDKAGGPQTSKVLKFAVGVFGLHSVVLTAQRCAVLLQTWA
jgi:hypothetical protein